MSALQKVLLTVESASQYQNLTKVNNKTSEILDILS